MKKEMKISKVTDLFLGISILSLICLLSKKSSSQEAISIWEIFFCSLQLIATNILFWLDFNNKKH
jgi:hypothetical protein